MTKQEVLERLSRSQIVPVIRGSSAEEALAVIEALLEGGIDILEITMTVPGAVHLINQVVERFGDDALVGAGTVLNPIAAIDCIKAGAQFIVCPMLDELTIETCQAAEVVCAPGALTPTEVVKAYEAGGDVIKIFPCDAVGGAGYLKALKAPLPHIPLMPTGGVTLESIRSFLSAGAVAVGVGSSLVNPSLSHKDLVARAQAFRNAVPKG